MNKRINSLRKQIADERKWIEDHGRGIAGYVLRYGSSREPEHFGDGGEAIYAADAAKLAGLESELAMLTGES